GSTTSKALRRSVATISRWSQSTSYTSRTLPLRQSFSAGRRVWKTGLGSDIGAICSVGRTESTITAEGLEDGKSKSRGGKKDYGWEAESSLTSPCSERRWTTAP